MTKRMGLMALGLSVMMFTGCSTVDDLVNEYAEEEYQGYQDDGNTNSGGTNPAAETGIAYYIDSAVSGVNYKCGSKEGITGSLGEFTFEVGSSCTFYLGDMELRGVDAGLLVDGESVYETDVNIARILQSLDSDGNPDNGITIKEDTVQALADEGITSLPTSEAEMDEMLAVVAANGGTEVSEEDAAGHMFTTLLGSKTFYVVGQDLSDATDIWGGKATFNADLTELTYIEAYGSETGETEIAPISINGSRLVFGNDTDGSYTVIGENKGDYIEVTDYYSGGTIESHTRLYFEQAKAEAYATTLGAGGSLSSIAITETMLSGKTFYDTFTDYNDGVCYANMTMSATSGTRHEVCYNSDGSEKGYETFTFSVALIDGKIKIDAGDQYKWFTLTAQDNTAWYMLNDDDDGKDGTLDSIGEQDTWHLSKPTDFPESL